MNRVIVGVRAKRACCTMPSISKQNRVSYPIITPSAARGVLSSVLLKPEFDWMVTRIAVLKMGRSDNIYVNEVKFPSKTVPFSAVDNRIQVEMRILRDVEYVIEAEPVVLDRGTPEDPNTVGKYLAEFAKRMDGRKPFYCTPCIGLRQFVARVYRMDEFPKRGVSLPDMRFEGMLVGLSHGDQRRDGGETHPCFATLEMRNGIVNVPKFLGRDFRPGPGKGTV